MASATKRPRAGASPKRGKTGGSLFTGLLVGLVIGITAAIGVAYYINHSASPFNGLGHEEKPVLSAIGTPPPPKAKNKGPETLRPSVSKDEVVPKIASDDASAASAAVSLDFYTMLPGLNETKRSEPKATAAPSKPEEKPLATITQQKGAYLQAGAFQDEYDADNLKAKLALLGVEARIQTQKIPEKGIWHRVRIGPFDSNADIERTRAQLHANGINSVIVKNN